MFDETELLRRRPMEAAVQILDEVHRDQIWRFTPDMAFVNPFLRPHMRGSLLCQGPVFNGFQLAGKSRLDIMQARVVALNQV